MSTHDYPDTSTPTCQKPLPRAADAKKKALLSLPVDSSPTVLSSETKRLNHWNKRSSRKDITTILWYALAVTLPMLALSATLLGLVYGYRVDRSAANEMSSRWGNSSDKLGNGYIYVHFSSTQLMFITSWSSSFAPFLVAFLMKLWHIEASREIVEASQDNNPERLVTPFQLSLIIRMCNGTPTELISCVRYFYWPKRGRRPWVYIKTALVLIFSGILTLSILGADTALHYITPTILYRTYLSSTSNFSPSRGLQDICIGFNRSENYGSPCSWIMKSSENGNDIDQYLNNGAEANSLMYSRSQKSEIRSIDGPDLKQGSLLGLFPRARDVPPHLSFRAATVGVSTQCAPMTRKCSTSFRGSLPRYFDHLPVAFNCSPMFWGNFNHTQENDIARLLLTFVSSDVNEQYTTEGIYGYFPDANMSEPYNPKGGFNGGWHEEDPEISMPILPDSELVNPIYLGVAGTLIVGNDTTGKRLSRDPEVRYVSSASQTALLFLHCGVFTYDVRYRWSNGTIDQVERSLTNGSIAELYHGASANFNEEIANGWLFGGLQSSSEDFARDFANSHSNIALSVIGSVMQPLHALEAASWEDILVAKVPVWALWSLIASNILFALFGLVLAIRAYMATTSRGLRDLVTKVGVSGMIAASLEDGPPRKEAEPVASEEELFEESRVGDASRRIGVYANGNGGFDFVTFL